jgi:L-lysine exporter family protein LysE/ArgO
MGSSTGVSPSAKKVATTVLGFTFLNPHVYLDTVILLGSISNQFKEDRWFFSLGAMLASIVWFTSIGYGAKAMSRYMSKPIFWKILDSIIACVIFSIAGYLAFATL